MHQARTQELTRESLPSDIREDEDKACRRLFVLQIVHPGLEGLMDGSFSTSPASFSTRGRFCGHKELPPWGANIFLFHQVAPVGDAEFGKYVG